MNKPGGEENRREMGRAKRVSKKSILTAFSLGRRKRGDEWAVGSSEI